MHFKAPEQNALKNLKRRRPLRFYSSISGLYAKKWG
jgi:hypothetical protein